MRKNLVKQKIQAGQPSFGIGLPWPSPELAEFCGHLGFEWLWLDIEHGQYDLQTLSNIVRAAEVSGMVPIARMPKASDPEQILKYLETGILGIIGSHIRSKEDVEFLVRAVKYPPIGIRSASMMRPARWGVDLTQAEYYEAANRETMIMALVEEKEGIDNLAEILSVDELDAVVIGPGDLSLTLGYAGQYDHPEVAGLVKRAQGQVLASRKALQVTVHDGKSARQWVKDGALLIRCGVQHILAPACKSWLQAARG
jgi:2-keto-3-deoxy-L-rhamnonate aldolase RhmA